MDASKNSQASMLTLVRGNRPLRRLLAALAVSQVGDWLYNLALLALVYDRTHSVTWTAVTTAARVLPIVLLSPFGGVLADRRDRRRLMIVSDMVRIGCMVLLAVVAGVGLPVLLAPLLAAA
jgi:MFS family permease